MAIQPYQEDDTVDDPQDVTKKTAKRIRWATQKAPGAKGILKRQSILRRLSHRRGNEKGGRPNSDPGADGARTDGLGDNEDNSPAAAPARRIFFNIPLPDDMRDQDGHPVSHFPRNKIRTAKYTPLSFIPKNLYFQFHNIANIYFLFIIILGVCIARLALPRSITCNVVH